MKRLLLLLLFVALVITINAQQRMNVKPLGTSNITIVPAPEKTAPVSNTIRTIETEKGMATIYPNIRVLPTTGNQTEISATIWTQNPNYICVGVNSDPGQGYYYTTNGGTTWGGADLLPNSISSSSDPALCFDNNGTVHFNYFDNAMVSDRSTNGGVNWLGRTNIPYTGSFDKNHNTVDVNPSSPYYGRIYVVWSYFTPSQPPIVLSYSTNGGVSYTSQQQIGSPTSGHYEQGCNIQVGPNGEVYCVWAAPISSSPYTEDFLGFTKSTNGGVNWTTPTNIIDINGIRGNILSTSIRVNSFPSMAVDRSGGPRNGYIYLVWGQKNLAPAGSDADICFAYSSNQGATWSTPVRVNDDPLNNGKQQFFPWMTVDQSNGNIAIVFYDTRDVSTTDSCDTYIAVSNNGGLTFTNIKASDHAQRPAPLSGYATGYYGDYIGIVAHNNVIWPFWMDNRNGPAQVYTCKISLGPSIAHTPLMDTENMTGPYVVNATITGFGSGIMAGQTRLFWSRNSTNLTDSVVMTNTSGNNYSGNIPGNGTASIYRYYIKTIDSLGRVSTLPGGAPANYYQFRAAPDTTKPVIVHTQLNDVPKTAWPATVGATVTDNIGVDSVWVRWYKNSSTTGIKHFKLNSQGNNTFSALFNSDTSQVTYGDSIFYRVFARDNSSNHNIDSTALYKFKITAISIATIGTGTTSVGWPYYTYYHDSRTQMLYLASEITAAGGSLGRIMKIGFDVVSAASQVMNGFYIKMKNTNITSLTAWETGLTDVYSGTYAVPGTGWQHVTLQTPFEWDGTSNVLIEICFDNTSYTSNSTVNSSTTTGTLNRHYHMDNGTGCTMTSTSTAATRPNIVLTIDVTPIPVELTSFTYSLNYNDVVLNWVTATEKNNHGFFIERKAANTDAKYSTLGFIPGNGTTTETHLYAFSDKKVTEGKYTYRLRQVDYDGTFSYTPEIEVDVNTPKVFALEQNYPNPFNPNTSIKYSIAKDGLVNISIYNALGEKVGVLVNEIQKAGNYDVTFNAKQFASGVYFYRMESGNFTSIKKMILIK